MVGSMKDMVKFLKYPVKVGEGCVEVRVCMRILMC